MIIIVFVLIFFQFSKELLLSHTISNFFICTRFRKYQSANFASFRIVSLQRRIEESRTLEVWLGVYFLLLVEVLRLHFVLSVLIDQQRGKLRQVG